MSHLRARAGILAFILIGLTAPRAHAYEQLANKHVLVELENGRKVCGIVVEEDEETVTVKLGSEFRKSANRAPYDRSDVKLTNLEPQWQAILQKCKDAKTAKDWDAVAHAIRDLGYDKPDYIDCYTKAKALDADDAEANEALGLVARTTDRGTKKWMTKAAAKNFDIVGHNVHGEAATEEGSWYANRKLILWPPDAPQYQIITNCPNDLAQDYAQFMVSVRKNLSELIEQKVGVKPPWTNNRNLCQVCKGSGKSTGGDKCKHCGGSGDEPCTIFITNSHKLFMDVTGNASNIGGYYTPGPFPPGNTPGLTCSRPIVAFHGTFGQVGGNEYGTLAHEGTHQAEHLMWKGDDAALFYRPGWLTEGLAVFFGDGLDLSQKAKGKFVVGIPTERLLGLRHDLVMGPGGKPKYPLKVFTSYSISEFQHDPGLYSFGWSLIYFMINCPDKFSYGGKEIDLKKAFGTFFLDNCEKGALEEFPAQDQQSGLPSYGFLGLARAMGIDQAKAQDALDQLEIKWKAYILSLPLKSVGEFDKNDKQHFVSEEAGFEFRLPGNKKHKAKFAWTMIPLENLVLYSPFDEVLGIQADGGVARVYICGSGNLQRYDVDQALAITIRDWTRIPVIEGWKQLDAPAEGTLPDSPVEYRLVEWEGKEKLLPGYVDNPRSGPQRGRMLVVTTADKIYKVVIMCDQDRFQDYESELNDILTSFNITKG